MDFIYSLISENPDYFAWVFGVINVFWMIFIYFNKQRHERGIEELKHIHNLDLEKRKSLYLLKSKEYESYVQKLDEYGRKYQVDLPSEMEPINDKYHSLIFEASMKGDGEMLQRVSMEYGKELNRILQNNMNDYLKIKAESNKLKLTASKQLLMIFEELESFMMEMFDKTNEFVGKFTDLVNANNQSSIDLYTLKLKDINSKVTDKKQELIYQMRIELEDI